MLVAASLIFALGIGETQAKKKKGHSEGVDVMCPAKGGKTLVGKLFSIQPVAREITIKTKDGSKEFRLAGNCKLSTANKPEVELTDRKLGEEVRINYFTTKLDTDVACSITPASGPAKKSAM